jgi:hypothetical protein
MLLCWQLDKQRAFLNTTALARPLWAAVGITYFTIYNASYLGFNGGLALTAEDILFLQSWLRRDAAPAARTTLE